MKILQFLLTLFCAVSICVSVDVPDFIHVCHRNDPNLSECVSRAAEDLRPYLATGVPEYNVPSLEPLYMEELIRDRQGQLQITARDVKAYGASNFFVQDLTLHKDTEKYVFNVQLPHLLIEAEYGIDGKVLLLPIKGSGPMVANITDILANVVLQGQITEKDGEKYLSFSSLDLKVNIGGGTGRLDNLFNGDKVLGDLINDTINKNMDAFLKELLPVIEQNLARVFLQIANNMVEPYTFDQLFPQ